MNDAAKQDFTFRALRGELTHDEEASFNQLLARDDEFRLNWEMERALNDTLLQLPDAPVSSNFTSRVLIAATRQEVQSGGASRAARLPFLRWSFGLALAIVFTLTIARQHHSTKQRQMAEALNVFRDIATGVSLPELAPAEVFANFDSIQRLSLPAESELDMELLVALQK